MGEQGAEAEVLSGIVNGTEFVSVIHSVGNVMFTADKVSNGGGQILGVTIIRYLLQNMERRGFALDLLARRSRRISYFDHHMLMKYGFGHARTQVTITIKINTITSKLDCSGLSVAL